MSEQSNVRSALEQQGFMPDAIDGELQHAHTRQAEEARNSRLLAVRDVFDRIGYGSTTPQFVNILFYLSFQRWPYVLFLVGMLTGIKTLASVVWSNILQEYNKVHHFRKDIITAAGIVYGFSFLLLAFSLLLHSVALFAFAFLLGTIGIVAYGDLYQNFVHQVIRRERMSWLLRASARWGVLITAATLLFAGFLLDAYPLAGTPVDLLLFGSTYSLVAYGHLFMFLIGTFSFILSGYATSFVRETAERREFPFLRFLSEYYHILKYKVSVFWTDKYVAMLTAASLISGLLQIIMTAYSGIAIFKILDASYTTPFFALALVYAIAIIAAFTGPFFTQGIHRSTGLAPTMVFGTLLMAVLPAALVYTEYADLHVAAIAAALCLNVIGGAITGFSQGLLARKLLHENVRNDYYRAQSFIIVIPYLIAIPLYSLIANIFPLTYLFTAVALGFTLIVMPIYFGLVVVSQRIQL